MTFSCRLKRIISLTAMRVQKLRDRGKISRDAILSSSDDFPSDSIPTPDHPVATPDPRRHPASA
eukprot:scaffold7695_cov430-Pinguiococcus_pyrenoidosus.AAC.1